MLRRHWKLGKFKFSNFLKVFIDAIIVFKRVFFFLGPCSLIKYLQTQNSLRK